MNIFKITTVAFLIVSTSFAMAAGKSDPMHGEMIRDNEIAMQKYASSLGKNPPEVVHYRYGMELDIADVIHITPINTTCYDVMPAQMTYLDSNEDLIILEYRAAGTDCQG